MKIAINGFGRIGRTFFRAAYEKKLDIVAVNDLTDIATLGHLLKYDSTYGKFAGEVEMDEGRILVDKKPIIVTAEKEPHNLPWEKLDIDIVVESTGVFTSYEGAAGHLKAGAKLVIVTAPCKGEREVKTFVLGVNEDKFEPQKDKVISMASCTTNCLTPVADVLERAFGIEKATLSTIHAVTMDQVLQDSPHKDLRRARAATQSIIPTTTGATDATAKVIPSLKDKMDGISFRVPLPTVSVIDFVALLKKRVDREKVNEVLSQAAQDPKYKGSLAVSKEPLVSVDFKSHPAGAIVDISLTQVVADNLVRVVAWYDNEMGYSHRLAAFIDFLDGKIK